MQDIRQDLPRPSSTSTRPSQHSGNSSQSGRSGRNGNNTSTISPSLSPPSDIPRQQISETGLVLPDSDATRRQIQEGGSSLTFLQLALGIVQRLSDRLDREPDRVRFQDELRFLRDCLHAGRARTEVACQLMESDEEANDVVRRVFTSSASWVVGTSEKVPLRRKDYELCGMLRAVRASPTGAAGSDAVAVVSTQGLPWMGPALPIWPVPESSIAGTTRLRTLLDEQFNHWDFDVFRLDELTHKRPLLFAGWEAFCRSGVFCEFPLRWESVTSFLEEAEKGYQRDTDVPFHNRIHAADVTQTMHALLQMGVGAFYDPMDFLVSILSAVIHDMGHDGKNNNFHVTSQGPLALAYNDRSVLENHHLATAFKLLAGNKNANMLATLSREQRRVVRQEVIDMVLGTDMSQHFAKVSDMYEIFERLGNDPLVWQADEPSMYALRCMVLHSADISNPLKPLRLARSWAYRAMQEFFAQGDMERVMGLPLSPMCDRKTTDIVGSQIGFLQFVVQPSFVALAKVAPKVHNTCISEAAVNLKAWQAKANSNDDAFSDLGGLQMTSMPSDFHAELMPEPVVEDGGVGDHQSRYVTDGPCEDSARAGSASRGGGTSMGCLLSNIWC